MQDGSQITVAIPTYRGARHLGEALQGILGQHEVSFDLLVSDDRSDDETVEIAKTLAGDRARIVVNSERLGLAGNWNRCVALSQTPLVAIFHQDDRMRPGHLAAHVSAFKSDPRIGLVCNATTTIDEQGVPVPSSVVDPGGIGPADRSFAPGELVRLIASRNPLRCSAVSLRTAAHAAVGGFDARYRYVVDWDFWIRVAREWGVAWLARPTVEVRWHRASETYRFRTGTTDLEESARLHTELFSRDAHAWPDASELRVASTRVLARAYLNRAHDLLHAGAPASARDCLKRALALSPRIVATIGADPRLAVQMTALALFPGLAGRWFDRSPADHDSSTASMTRAIG